MLALICVVTAHEYGAMACNGHHLIWDQLYHHSILILSTGRREWNMDPTKEMTDYILEAPEACSHRIREQALQRALEPLFLCSLVLVILHHSADDSLIDSGYP